MTKRIFTFILALVAIATTAGAQTKYDIWVGGVQVTSANASNITGGDIKGGTVKYDATENELILRNVTITRSGKSKQGIRNQVAGLTITFFGTNTITTDNSCALRCDANTYLWMMPNSKTTFTEKQQEAFYVTGGKSLFITGSHLTELYVNSTNEYAVEGEKGTETVTFQGGPVVTLNGKKGSLVKLGKVVFTESQNKSTSVTLKATNNSSYPQVQNVAAWVEEGYNHIDAPIGLTSTHPVYKSSEKTVLVPWGHLKGNITSYDIVINEDVVPLNSTTFPDANFLAEVKKLCSNYNQNGYLNRGFLSKPMVKAVKQMDVSSKKIGNLKGVEHFTELTSLECAGNFLTSLDVSKNAALTKLRCNWNELTSLNVSGCTELTSLECGLNFLTSLNVSGCTALTRLDCVNNQLTSLDVSKNTKLTELDCNKNKLTSLDVSKNTALTQLECGGNQLTSLDVSKNTALTDLRCSNNQLTSLNVSKSTALIILWCGNNQLTSLDVSKNTALEWLRCSSNQLTSLNVSTALEWLHCNDNQLTSLDLSKNTALELLSCYDNQLTSLDVSKNTALTELYCFGNQIKGDKMQALVNSLPKVAKEGKFYVINTKNKNEGNVITKSQVAIAKGKGWKVYDYNDGDEKEYAGSVEGIEINATNFPDANFRSYVSDATIDKDKDGYLSDAEIANATSINVSKKNIANLKGIEYFTALTYLDCSANQLTSLDVSKNTKLEWLFCYSNKLTALDVSKNTALGRLECGNNQLTKLDVSKNTEMYWLACYNNQLTALDVSKNTKLRDFYCDNNKIKGDKMQALVNSLPKVSIGFFFVFDTKKNTEQNVITKSQVAIAKGKGWKVVDPYGNEYAGSDDTPTSIDNGQLIIDNLDGDWYSIDGVKLNGEPKKKGIYIRNGKKVVK